MILQRLQDKLEDLLSKCESLARLLRAEREALKTWRLQQAEVLTMEKELILEDLRCTDQEFKAEVEAFARSLGCRPSEVFERPGAEDLKSLRERVRLANQQVRHEGELTQISAEHAMRFLNRLHQAGSEPQLSYADRVSPSVRRAASSYF